jgi:preprotein translocase SecE subunit
VAEAVEGKKKEGVGEFIQKTREEMTRVSFPSGEDVRKTTIIVIIASSFSPFSFLWSISCGSTFWKA